MGLFRNPFRKVLHEFIIKNQIFEAKNIAIIVKFFKLIVKYIVLENLIVNRIALAALAHDRQSAALEHVLTKLYTYFRSILANIVMKKETIKVYLVCSHINSAEDNFKCFVCDEHMINRQSCLQIPRNRKKMEKMSFVEKERDILKICDQIEKFKLDPKSFLEKASDDIINKIDLKREVLKTNLNKQVDNYYESLLNEVKEKQLNIIDSVKVDFEGINTQEIREKLNLDSDVNSTDYQVRIKSLVDLRSSYLGEHLKNFQNFQNIEFFDGEEEPEIIMPKLFGTIDLIDSNDIFKSNSIPFTYSKSLSNEFQLIAQVGLQYNLELNTGELVFTSQSKKSNLLIFNPQSGKICEVPTQHEIKYLFKSDDDEIITIDSEFLVKIWNNFICINTYDLVRTNLINAELVEDKIVTITKDYFVTVMKFSDGQIFNHFNFKTNIFDSSAKTFSDSIILMNIKKYCCRLTCLSGFI
ncbi:hypothetical protein BpHYR1_022548, partial [Brachionus plicatilis]